MAKSLMICANSKCALRLNESDNLPEKKYILEGVFAELDKLNRNQRIYPKEEYLKHLQYLRADIKSGEPLLGELDHPDDRFEVKLKEASHRVIDLWYDSAKNVVMGKIELLNTPNGKTAQSIVDQGIPLHISSRAAGTVNSDNTVSIQQIYTYDLVCKPGFAGCVLHRVAESAGDARQYSDDVKAFLSNSLKSESMNSAPQYGIVCENVSVAELKAPAILRKEAKDLINKQTQISEDMSKPLLENTNPDATVGKPLNISGGGAAALGIPTADLGGTNEASDSESDKEKKDKEEKKECPKCGKTPCECKDCKNGECKDKEETNEDKEEEKPEKPAEKTNEGDDSEDDDNKSDDNEKSDDNADDDSSDDENSDDNSSEDTGVEIIDVEAEFESDDKEGSDDDMIKDVEADYGDDDKDDSEKSDEDSESNDEESDEDETSEAKDEDAPTDEDDKNAKEAEKLSDKAVKDIESHRDSVFKKLDDLKAAIEKKNSEKKESKNESIIMARYPVSMCMNESNFAKFAGLNESQKTRVMNYLADNKFTTSKLINENWENGIDYVSPEPVWLKNAPKTYRDLYEAASDTVKQNLAITAKYILFESQEDVNTFWENSNLADIDEKRILNESFVRNLPKVTAAPVETNLPYSKDFIQQIADMASEYNTHRY